MQPIFHLAFNVADLDVARHFYGTVLGCHEGRSTDTWVDFDFFGHQISMHLGPPFHTERTGHVGDQRVPMPHFGVIMALPAFRAVADRLAAADIDFILPPQVRFKGEPGEQWTMFFNDPFGTPIELKGFADGGTLFAR